METITLNAYKLEELQKPQQARAIENYLNEYFEYLEHDEFQATLNAFADCIGATIKDYQINQAGHSYIKLSTYFSEELLALRGNRLRTWIVNNWLPLFEKPKYLGLITITGKESGIKSRHFRHSRLQKVIDCPLTGMTYDHDAIQPILNFTAKPNDSDSLADIVEACADSLCHAWLKDIEFRTSEEYLREEITDNEMRFFDNGKLCLIGG